MFYFGSSYLHKEFIEEIKHLQYVEYNMNIVQGPHFCFSFIC